MGILQKWFGKKNNDVNSSSAGDGGMQASTLPVVPEEIYKKASLEFQDIIAPSALKN